jgi:hypothetical protein
LEKPEKLAARYGKEGKLVSPELSKAWYWVVRIIRHIWYLILLCHVVPMSLFLKCKRSNIEQIPLRKGSQFLPRNGTKYLRHV